MFEIYEFVFLLLLREREKLFLVVMCRRENEREREKHTYRKVQLYYDYVRSCDVTCNNNNNTTQIVDIYIFIKHQPIYMHS